MTMHEVLVGPVTVTCWCCGHRLLQVSEQSLVDLTVLTCGVCGAQMDGAP